jgi:hypothetical protein
MTRPRDADRRSGPGPWRPVTRRAFVSALGAAAAALAVRRATRGIAQGDAQDEDDRPPSRWTGTTRWIGHC